MRTKLPACLMLVALMLVGRMQALADPPASSPAAAAPRCPWPRRRWPRRPARPPSIAATSWKTRSSPSFPSAAQLARRGSRAGPRVVRRRARRRTEARLRRWPCATMSARFASIRRPCSALREIVPLAFNLDRQAEAVRYALILAEHDPSDPLLLRRLAIYLTEDGDTSGPCGCTKRRSSCRAQRRKAELRRGADCGWRWAGCTSSTKSTTRRPSGSTTWPRRWRAAGVRSRRHDAEGAAEQGRVDLPALWREFSGGRAGRPKRWPPSRRPKPSSPTRRCTCTTWPASTPEQKQPAQALAKLETYFDKHYTSQGTGAYQLLGRGARSRWASRGNSSSGWKNSTPPTPKTCRWPTFWPNNIARPASSTRPSRSIAR